MNKDLNNLNFRLTVRNETLSIVNKLLKDMLYTSPPDNISIALFSQLALTYAKENTDAIFKSATSPTQKIFLNALQISALTKGVLFLRMTETVNSATKKIQIARKNYNGTLHIWNLFQEQTGEKSMNMFIDFINNEPISESLKNQIMTDMLFNIYDIYKTFMFSIKSNFQEFSLMNKKTIETDIFVWTISEPQFRLVVECDEYNYNFDKSTFSRDRARDRLLQSKGYQVLRFSSQEIISNPLGKAKELIDYLERCRGGFPSRGSK